MEGVEVEQRGLQAGGGPWVHSCTAAGGGPGGTKSGTQLRSERVGWTGWAQVPGGSRMGGGPGRGCHQQQVRPWELLLPSSPG